MIAQRALVALALASGALAGVLYYAGAQRTTVVVAARDLDATHALTVDDLASAAVPPDALPPGALTDAARAIGRVPRAPVWKGQLLLADALGDDAASFHTGVSMPAGSRAVALPVGAAQAVGGAIVPGALVDVLAVPLAGRAPAGRTTELVARAALVLDVRTESGNPYAASTARAIVNERVGSVVVAIDAGDELRFADRIATSTFILALAPAP